MTALAPAEKNLLFRKNSKGLVTFRALIISVCLYNVTVILPASVL